MAAVDRAQQIEAHGLVPYRRDIDLADRRIFADRAARAVEENVELAELLFRRRNRCAHIAFTGHIGADERDRIPERATQCFARPFVDIRDGNLAPVFGKSDSDAPAEARSSSRNQSGSPRQVEQSSKL